MQVENFNSDIFWLAYGDYNGRRAVKPFVRYFVAKYMTITKQETWQTYVADSLNLIPQQKCLAVSYSNMIKTYKKDYKEQKADEIINDIMARHGLSFKKSGE